MEIQETEVLDILGNQDKNSEGQEGEVKKKKKRTGAPVVPMPTGASEPGPSGLSEAGTGAAHSFWHAEASVREVSLANELVETKHKLEMVTQEMDGMRSEIATLKMATAPKPLRIFALGFVPSVVLAKNHVDMLKYVAEVLSINMKKRMDGFRNYFNVIEVIRGVESVGVRTCPIFNRIEFCPVKWHHMSKMAKSGRMRADLRIHCCTLCLEALGIICGHPLFKCPWIYEDTWKKIPQGN